MRAKETKRSLYLRRVFSSEDTILKSIREQAQKDRVGYMQISAYEGGILQFLCRALKIKKVVEIGTLYGYSALMMARALPADGRVFTLDMDKKRQEKAQALTAKDPAGKKIRFLPGRASESLQKLTKQAPFDMVFIDADKNSYMDYLRWSNQNLKSGGLLTADNSFLFGAVYGEAERAQTDKKALKTMLAFNKEVAQSGLYTGTLIPTAEGLTVGIRK